MKDGAYKLAECWGHAEQWGWECRAADKRLSTRTKSQGFSEVMMSLEDAEVVCEVINMVAVAKRQNPIFKKFAMSLTTSFPLELVDQILYFSHVQKRQTNGTQKQILCFLCTLTWEPDLGGCPLFDCCFQSVFPPQFLLFRTISIGYVFCLLK